MKKFKKAAAITMAATMALVPMNVLADDVTDEGSAEGTVTGVGGIEGWVDDQQFCVTLPTTASEDLEFAIDPQGLSDSVGSTLGGETAGIIAFGDGAKVTLVNKSSFAVGFDVHVSLKSNDTALKVVASDAVETGTDRNIYMAAQPIESDEVVEDQDLALVASDTEGVAGEKKFAYALEDANDQYVVAQDDDGKYSYSLSGDADGFDTVTFGFAGAVNPNADWSGYAKDTDPLTMSLDVSYSVHKLGCGYDDATQVEGVHGLLTTEEAPSVNAAPSAPAAADFNNGKGQTGVYSTVITGVSLGNGDLAATDISSIKVGSTAVSKLTAVPTSATAKGYIYNAETETLTLYGPVIATTAAEGTKATLTIEFNDTAKTKQTIELTNKLR